MCTHICTNKGQGGGEQLTPYYGAWPLNILVPDIGTVKHNSPICQ